MQPAIIDNNGFIDKYIGDAIMALFPGNSDDAVKAGIAMLNKLPAYNKYRLNSGYIPIQNGIGINTGSLMLGTVGGQNHMNGTVISDAVNLASRMEGLTKNYGISMLISHSTFSKLKNPNAYAIRMIDTVKVKGKSELITIYEVFEADVPQVKEGKLATLNLFLEALNLYNDQKMREAGLLFQECLRQNSADTVAQIYWEKCQL
jgi:class 3 adenylate cyclase